MRDITLGETIYIDFTTLQFSDGVPTVLAGTPVLSVLEENNATPITSGVSISVSRASVVGLNEATIVATSGNGYETGKGYSVYISTGTVGGVSVVGVVVGEFTIEASAAFTRLGSPTGSGGNVNFQAIEDNTGGAIIDSIVFVGSVQSGTFSNTEAVDGVYHDIDDTSNDIDIVYGFSVGGGRTGTDVTFTGFVQGKNDEIKLKVFDHIGSDWEIIGTVIGANGTNNVVINVPLLLKHTGTGSELGKVYIRLETDSTTPSNLSVDGLIVAGVSIGQSVGYSNGSIWVDITNGVAGTEAFVNGVADNPVNLIASAKTLSTSVGISDFHIINGSTITLAETTDNESYFGDNWTLALGGQSCAGAHFDGATVSGIQTGTGCGFHGGEMGTATLADDAHLDEVGLASGTITLPAGEVFFNSCRHHGTTLPILDFGAAVGSTTVHLHAYAGGVEFQNFGDNGTDIVHIDGNGRLDINANSSGGTINIRGNWDIRNNASGVIINRHTGQSAGYANGAIYIDTNASNTNTINFADGVAENPVSTLVAAKTISGSIGINDFHILNGSSITLAENTENESYVGDHWVIALGGQACGGLYVQGATVSGVATSSGEEMHFEGCDVGTATVEQAHFDKCGFNGTVTLNTTDDYDLHGCYSKGAAVPVFTKTSGQTINFETQDWAGDITMSGLQSGDLVELGGFFRTVTLNGADATVHIHGHYETLTNNLTGSPTVQVTGAIKTQDVADILTDTNELQTDWKNAGRLDTILDARMAEASISTTGGAVDTVTAVTNQVTADMTAISGDTTAADKLEASMETLIVGTATGTPTSTTMADSSLTETTDNHYKGRIIIWRTGVLAEEATDITAYNGATKTFTFTAVIGGPASAGDSYVIL